MAEAKRASMLIDRASRLSGGVGLPAWPRGSSDARIGKLSSVVTPSSELTQLRRHYYSFVCLLDQARSSDIFLGKVRHIQGQGL